MALALPLVGLVHALTALNRNGHTGTGHEQRHDGEQRGARSTGERQLGDGLTFFTVLAVVLTKPHGSEVAVLARTAAP